MRNRQGKIKKSTADILLILAGVYLYAFGMRCFLIPNQIVPGGASGIAVLIKEVAGCSMGFFVFWFNAPLLLIIFIKKLYPFSFLLRTLFGTTMLAAVMDVELLFPITYQNDLLLATVFGGSLMGVGLALVHTGNSSTGGISLLGVILGKWGEWFPVGMLISLLNILVVLAAGVVYRNFESLLYALFCAWLSGIIMDRASRSFSARELLIVISECTDRVREEFLNSRTGITILKGEGGYSSDTQRVVLCAADKKDCLVMKKKIKRIDPAALIIVTGTNQVEGKGFSHLI